MLESAGEDVKAAADARDKPTGEALAERVVLDERAVLQLSSRAVCHGIAAAGRPQRRHVASRGGLRPDLRAARELHGPTVTCVVRGGPTWTDRASGFTDFLKSRIRG